MRTHQTASRSPLRVNIRDLKAALRELIVPDEIHENVEEIQFEGLFQKGYDTILLDVDNTILTYGDFKPGLQKTNWANRLKAMGYRVFLVSNNIRYFRFHTICKQLEVEGLYFAMKPLTLSTADFANHFHINLKKSIVVGDQVFADILMGNWLRAYTILVDPLGKKLSFIKTLQREIELFLLRQLEK